MNKEGLENYLEEHLLEKELKLDFFGNGEWVDEPDFVTFFYKSIKCIVRRQYIHTEKEDFGGFLCGYLEFPYSHKFFGKKAEEIDIDCHGGITFSEMEEEKFLVGFDCAHYGDIVPSTENLSNLLSSRYSPRMEKLKKEREEFYSKFPYGPPDFFKKSYRNIEYVIKQLKKMVDQLT